jgi:5-methyltetrahydropteroyltriglutamate--homocysteine methyltransferase
MLETTIVGSLPKPSWLAEPEKLWGAWRFQGAALKSAQQRAAVEWLKHQEEAGIEIVTDGEQFRIHFVHGFLENITGIDWEKKTAMGIRADRYTVQVFASPEPIPTVNLNSPFPDP